MMVSVYIPYHGLSFGWHRQPSYFSEKRASRNSLCSLINTRPPVAKIMKRGLKMSNVFVRNVTESDLKSIDYKVQKLQETDPKGRWNRSKYIRMLINNDAKKELENYEKTQYELMIKRLLELQGETFKTLNKILYLMTNGELPEAMNLLDKVANKDR